MNDKPKTISRDFTDRAVRRRNASFYSAFCSGALALLAGLTISHSALGAEVPAPVARLSALKMTESPDGTAMTVTGARYTARLSLPQGSLLSLRDQAAGQEISLGNSGGHLWVAHFIGRNDVKSGDYAAANVTWSWDAAKQTLTILYSASGDKLPAVRAQWQFSDQAWLDLSLTVDNQTGCVLRGVENNLRLPAATLESAILPVLPGIQLQRKFFTDRREWRHG
ncbi:MAG: hypothetical protein WCJ02_09300, partial [bacterium]